MINIENILRIKIIEDYNTAFGSMCSYDIAAVAEAIDMNIFNRIEDIFYSYTKFIVPNSTFNENAIDRKIRINNDYYKLQFNFLITSPKSLVVAYVRVYDKTEKFDKKKSKHLKLNGIGKYNKIEFLSPAIFKVNYELALKLIETTFDTSYAWIFQKLRSIIKENFINSSYLYSKIKVALYNQQHIANSIWFVVTMNDECTLVLDEDNVISALNRLNEFSFHPEMGPYKLLDEFVNMRLPYEKAFAQQALKKRKPVDGIIMNGKYFDDLPNLAVSQISILSKEVTVYPIHIEGKNHLYASFPTKHRSIIKPILDLSKEGIIEDFKNFNNRFKKMIKTMKANNLEVSRIAEFLGTFTGSFTKAVLKE